MFVKRPGAANPKPLPNKPTGTQMQVQADAELRKDEIKFEDIKFGIKIGEVCGVISNFYLVCYHGAFSLLMIFKKKKYF